MALSIKHARKESDKPRRQRPSRGTGQRTRSGCYTCKTRRVKCDETKPACRNCTAYGRVCEGYPDPSTLPLPPKDMSRSSSPNDSRKSSFYPVDPGTRSRTSSMTSVLSYLELYQFTMPSRPAYFAPGFWPHLVERVSKDQPAIQHALKALGAAHAAVVRGQGTASISIAVGSNDDSANEVALKHYNLAINKLAHIMTARGTNGTETILVCCFLFVCIEALFGNLESAIGHAEAGLKVYQDWLGNESPSAQVPLEVFSSSNPKYCIWRLGAELEAMLGDLTDQSPAIEDYGHVDDNSPWSFNLSTEQFFNAEHVTCAFVFLKRKLRSLLRTNGILQLTDQTYVSETILQQRQELENLYAAFERPYHNFMSMVPPEGVDRGILLLQMRYLVHSTLFSTISLATPTVTLEARFHDLLDTITMIMREIPSLDSSAPSSSSTDASTHNSSGTSDFWPAKDTVRLPSFSLSAEIVPCLFHAAKAAPTIQLRHRAISLLWAANAVEGVWNSHTAAKLAEDIFEAHRKGTPFTAFPSVDVPLGHYFGDR